jgi:selenocysteine lyase/cysteine desulfurase
MYTVRKADIMRREETGRKAMLDESLIQEEFPQDEGLIYLNHAAVAPWPARTAAAVRQFADENVRLGASRYDHWLATESNLRKQLQHLINAPSVGDISLLKNTSEGISIVACGLNWRRGDNVVSSDQEFPSNRIPWQAQAQHGVEFREVSLASLDPEAALMAACDSHTRVLAISSVQYASGIRLDLRRLGQYCHDHRILFCVDAIQSLGAIRLDVEAIHADFVMADAHKWLLGPEGIALFYCRAALREQLTLHQYGWHMRENAGDYDTREWRPAAGGRRFECGSNNLLGIHAFAASLSLLEQIGLAEIEKAVLDNTRLLVDKLTKIKAVSVLTPHTASAHAGIVTFRAAGHDPEVLHRKLRDTGVICACRGGGVRFSPHFYNTREQLDRAIKILTDNLK